MKHATFLKHKGSCFRPLDRSINSGASSSHGLVEDTSSGALDISGEENVGPGQEMEAIDATDVEEESDDSEVSEQLPIEEVLQNCARTLLGHIKEGCNATQHIVKEVMRGVDDIQDVYLEVIKQKFKEHAGINEAVSINDAYEVIDKLKGCSIFEVLQNMEQFLLGTGMLVPPQKISLLSRQELRGLNVVSTDVDTAYIVPFLPQLEKLLNCEDVMKCVDNPQVSPPGVFRSILDGAFYRNHPVYLKDNKALAVIAFTDGAEYVDGASTRTGKHGTTYSGCLAISSQSYALLIELSCFWLQFKIRPYVSMALSQFSETSNKDSPNLLQMRE
ncbi:hypothetical protein ONE63_003448 [Megalurothrips usitatus]|uniref:Uncharacterized protein n=1 Tax=Megalurothrips usitatus TaxID=439358 RepID=A0AAV7XBJ7_9NEOP|nr:hypothetical protein ONE63_003448 [Megalurothrips usitatus]